MLNTIAAAAADYHERGWKPVPVNRKSKKPIGKNWQNKPYSPTQFNGNSQNVGIQLGAISGGLVDIDLDEKAAIGLAPEFLPPTGAVFGRKNRAVINSICVAISAQARSRRYSSGDTSTGSRPTSSWSCELAATARALLPFFRRQCM